MFEHEFKKRQAYERISRRPNAIAGVAGGLLRERGCAAVLGFFPPYEVFDVLTAEQYAKFIAELAQCEWRRGRPAEHQAHLDYFDGPRLWRRDAYKMLGIAAAGERYDVIDSHFKSINCEHWEQLFDSWNLSQHFRATYLPRLLKGGVLRHGPALHRELFPNRGEPDENLPFLFVPYLSRENIHCEGCGAWIESVLG